MTQPFFTIRTATYNRAHTLPRVFKSLQEQTFQDFEWIIGDDGSTDNTSDIVAQFQKEASFKIVYLKLEHKGKQHACQQMKKHISGKWSAWIDSDDEYYSKNTLMELFDCIQSLPKDQIFTAIGGCFINQHDEVFPKLNKDFVDIDKDIFIENLTKNTGLLNNFSIANMKYINSQKESYYKNDVPAYPEIVLAVHGVLKSQNYYVRLFNKPLYRYHMFNNDSVTVTRKNTLTMWYYDVDMVNLFYEFNLAEKYKTYVHNLLNDLGKKHYKKKGFFATLKALQTKDAKKWFIYACLIRRYLKYLFLIDKDERKTRYYLLGIKLYTKKYKPNFK